jgi:hypothetical protein
LLAGHTPRLIDEWQIGAVENILTAPNGSRNNLASDIYTVTFEIERSDNKSVVWNELLHIYSTLQSNFTHTFSDVHFNNPVYNVIFNNNYPNGGYTTQSVIHGFSFNNNPNNPTTPTPVRTADVYLYRNNNLPNPDAMRLDLLLATGMQTHKGQEAVLILPIHVYIAILLFMQDGQVPLIFI